MSRRAAPLLLLAVAALGAACAEAPTGTEAFALGFERLPFPAVVVGDTLRDETGAVAPLAAQVFGADGTPLDEVPVTYLLLDPGATLLEGGYVRGDSAGETVEVVAEGAGIPSLPLTLTVVPAAPDTLALLTTEPDTARYSSRGPKNPFVLADTSGRLEVQVLHAPEGAESDGVASWVVRYDMTIYAGTQVVGNDTLAMLVGENNRSSPLDTTDTQGRAWRRILLNGARPAIDAVDSVVVSVTILGRPAGTVRSPAVRVAVPVRPR
jgi:hypothetical protein